MKIFIRIPTTGKIYTYKPPKPLKPNQEVLLALDGIVEKGVVTALENFSKEEGIGEILRLVTDEDRQSLKAAKEAAKGYILETQKKAHRHGLKIKILDADLSFDEKKLTFYFTADERVDFRTLVTDLAKSFNKLIRLQQVGARDEAKYFGGIGKCGRELCCGKFLKNLESITLEMAQTQELSFAGSAKLSGCCGKLMCCLSFEAQNYQELKKRMPKIGSQFSSSLGSGKVVGYNLLEGKIILETKEGKRLEEMA